MVHQAQHADVAPVVVVVARTRDALALAVDRKLALYASFGHGGQPGKEVLVVLAKEDLPRAGPPGGYTPGQSDFRANLFAGETNRIGVQVAGKDVFANFNVAAFAGGKELCRGKREQFFVVRAVRRVVLERHGRRQRAVGRYKTLGEEHDYELAAVVEVAVEIPPFVAAAPAVGAHAVLPGLDARGVQAEVLEIFFSEADAGWNYFLHCLPTSTKEWNDETQNLI
ncbi:hypothetical protein SDC9_84237 [bioreactor metagenome]|uniref:Uncharacterized protein n=1 Tax=bioreactor metagenome TaxID=1076179 RepID=A0A644ZA94_9ZZZZ